MADQETGALTEPIQTADKAAEVAPSDVRMQNFENQAKTFSIFSE